MYYKLKFITFVKAFGFSIAPVVMRTPCFVPGMLGHVSCGVRYGHEFTVEIFRVLKPEDAMMMLVNILSYKMWLCVLFSYD
jgi:hypothetical protein